MISKIVNICDLTFLLKTTTKRMFQYFSFKSDDELIHDHGHASSLIRSLISFCTLLVYSLPPAMPVWIPRKSGNRLYLNGFMKCRVRS